MSVFECVEPRPGLLVLRGELTVSDAPALHGLLVEALRRSPSLELDLLDVTMLDTSGVQLMIALSRAGRAAGKPVCWQGFSAAVEHVLNVLNLRAEIGEPSAVVWT